VEPSLLGRTNRAFPEVWLSLATPPLPCDGWTERLVEAAAAADTVIDLTSGAALFGGSLRGRDDLTLMVQAPDIARLATSETHATDLLQAHLIEVLSAIGREFLDIYVLPVASAMEEFQANGALAALESARQDGHISYLALGATGHPLAALGFLQFHDAFDLIVLPDSEEARSTLVPIAEQRRVGVVSKGSRGNPRLVTVRSAEEVSEAMRGPAVVA